MVRNALRFTARPPATAVHNALARPLRAALVSPYHLVVGTSFTFGR